MIKILHVFPDDKFFDVTSDFFDAIPDVENRYIYHTTESNYKFRYINKFSKVEIITDKRKYFDVLGSDETDIVYFHSLSPNWYDYVLKVHPKVKIIWWVWGYDVYNQWRACDALIKLDLHKPLTRKAIGLGKKHRNLIRIFRSLYYSLTYARDTFKRRKAIERIDYFSPVLDIEYKLMKEHCAFFRAEPFMINTGPGEARFHNLPKIRKLGNILIGNSLADTNNHLDLFSAVAGCELREDQKYVIPICYGSGLNKALIKDSFPNPQVQWIDDFLPVDQYNMLLDSISYAVFGVMRQQAIGNIAACFKKGIKVFLYSDSIVYKHFISNGFVVFKIEDIGPDSFSLPLDPVDAYSNYSILKNKWDNNLDYASQEIKRIMGMEHNSI